MEKFRLSEIKCPFCGKRLVCLSDTEEEVNEYFRFWCDDCDVDITVEAN